MQRVILTRLFHGVVTIIVVSMIVFVLSRLTGDPAGAMLPLEATEEQRAAMNRALSLDKPIYEQYWVFISKAVRGDLGESIKFREPASTLYAQRLPNTVRLALAAILFVILVSVPLGAITAFTKDTFFDYGSRWFVSVGLAIPSFWLGLVLMQVFAVWLRWVEPTGMSSPAHYILPAITLGMGMAAGMTRILRSGMVDVLDSEFVKMLRIKGLPEKAVIFRHAFRNAIIPPLTLLGQYTALVFGGAVVVEVIFTWPGVGRLAYEAVLARDFPVLQAVVLFNGVILVVTNLLVDILYAYIDPRIRSSV